MTMTSKKTATTAKKIAAAALVAASLAASAVITVVWGVGGGDGGGRVNGGGSVVGVGGGGGKWEVGEDCIYRMVRITRARLCSSFLSFFLPPRYIRPSVSNAFLSPQSLLPRSAST